jgi:glyceraldehyde-3-phosphate dehydrogenase (NAD(P))
VPETAVPSHQEPDAQAVIPELRITTMAAAGPFNLGHVHFAMVETTRPAGVDELRAILLATPRVASVRAADGLRASNAVVELMRDLGRPRADIWEVAVWEDALASRDSELYMTFQVHNEAIVIPETIDCIRALTALGVPTRGLVAQRSSTPGRRSKRSAVEPQHRRLRPHAFPVG